MWSLWGQPRSVDRYLPVGPVAGALQQEKEGHALSGDLPATGSTEPILLRVRKSPPQAQAP